jgi:hypothetical protein
VQGQSDGKGDGILYRDLSAAVALVRRAITGVELAWTESRLNRADFDLTFALGEASQSLHRALAALADWSDPGPPTR